jgi:hypothetical protein
VVGILLIAFAIWIVSIRKSSNKKQERAVAVSAKVQPDQEIDGTAVPELAAERRVELAAEYGSELAAEHGVSEAAGTRGIHGTTD